ncbi:MAG: PAS domain S-box protein [candidate division NC10 bacterium]
MGMSIEALEARYTEAAGALPEIEIKFPALLESAPVAIVIVDGDCRIVHVNAKTEQMFGYQRDELFDQTFEILVPERFRSTYVEHLAEFLLHPCARPMDLGLDPVGRRKDGTEFPLEVGLSYIRTQRGILVKNFIVDIAERRRSQEAPAS